MTNYNDGKWHGHNGGECPVHPETVVHAVYQNTHSFGEITGKAVDVAWDHPIIAFRVIKEHKQPREFWIHAGQIYMSKPKKIHGEEIIHVREVTE